MFNLTYDPKKIVKYLIFLCLSLKKARIDIKCRVFFYEFYEEEYLVYLFSFRMSKILLKKAYLLGNIREQRLTKLSNKIAKCVTKKIKKQTST